MVTIITTSRGRPYRLLKAIKYVQMQKYPGKIEHIILIDDDDTLTQRVIQKFKLPSNVYWYIVPNPNSEYGVVRIAKLRNLGVKLAEGEWIAIYDDDNIILPHHIRLLVEYANEYRALVAHSWRKLVYPDGRPYLEHRHPWTPDPQKAREFYWDLVRKGIMTPGSNLARDRADSSVITVDAGELLIRRDLLLAVRFSEKWTEEEILRNVGDDDKLVAELLRRNIKIVCTHGATLIYRLGGFSTTFVHIKKFLSEKKRR